MLRGPKMWGPAGPPGKPRLDRERQGRVLALGIVYLVWGSTYLGMRVMVEQIPAALGAASRFLVAGVLLAAWLRLRRHDAFRLPRRELAGAAAVGLLIVGGGTGVTTVAERFAPSGLAALVISAVPLWLVLARLADGERVAGVALVGVALGFVGVATVVVASGGIPEARPLGVALFVVASLGVAAGSFVSKRLRMPREPFASAAVGNLSAGLVFAVAGLAAGEASPERWSGAVGRPLLALVYLIVAGSLIAFSAYVWLLATAPVSVAGTYAYVNPIVALFLGWLLLDETLTAPMLAGAAVTIFSVAVVLAVESRPAVPAVEEELF